MRWGQEGLAVCQPLTNDLIWRVIQQTVKDMVEQITSLAVQGLR